jgi:hypothetical protein
VSDRPADRPVSLLVRASARKRAYTADGTDDGTSTHRRSARQPMSDQEREAIRKAGADDARRSRVEHGLPERIEDPAAVATLAAILRNPRAPPTESMDRERKPATSAESGGDDHGCLRRFVSGPRTRQIYSKLVHPVVSF